MVKYTPEDVFKRYEGWKKYMHSSWDRGDKNLAFIESSDQWEDDGSQDIEETEKFIFNYSKNVLMTAQANGKEIDLSLGVKGVGAHDQNEEKAFNLILTDLMIRGQNRMAIAQGLDKVYAFGQAVYHVKGVRDNEKTLNQVLRIECMKDPKEAFFDYGSLSPTFHDGNFCGRVYKMPSKKLGKIYKRLNIRNMDKEVDVADFWFKVKKEVEFVPLVNGQYKRIDLIDPARDSIIQGEVKKGLITSITYVRAIKGHPKFIEKRSNIQCQTLPMVFNYGGLVWTGKQYETFPLGWNVRDAQILLNYSGSLMADLMKGMNGDRFFFDESHVRSDDARDSANNVNSRSGGLIFTGDISKIRREVGQQIPGELVQVFGELQMMIQRLAGGYFEGDGSKIKAMSGVALDKMFNRVDLIQNPAIVAHLNTVNVLGLVVKEMIPIYYTENRVMGIQDCDGSIKTIEINKPVTQPNGMVVIENNVKDLTNRYEYEIKATPSKRLQDQNTETALNQIYQMYPQAIPSTIDVYVKSLNVESSDVLSRRLSVNIPPELIEYGCGEITFGQYQQIQQQKQMQAQQQQLKMEEMNPETQYLRARAQGEEARAHTEAMKAQTGAYEAQTARFKEMSSDKNTHIKNVSDAMRVHFDNQNAIEQRDFEMLKMKVQQMNDIIESLAGRRS